MKIMNFSRFIITQTALLQKRKCVFRVFNITLNKKETHDNRSFSMKLSLIDC